MSFRWSFKRFGCGKDMLRVNNVIDFSIGFRVGQRWSWRHSWSGFPSASQLIYGLDFPDTNNSTHTHTHTHTCTRVWRLKKRRETTVDRRATCFKSKHGIHCVQLRMLEVKGSVPLWPPSGNQWPGHHYEKTRMLDQLHARACVCVCWRSRARSSPTKKWIKGRPSTPDYQSFHVRGAISVRTVTGREGRSLVGHVDASLRLMAGRSPDSFACFGKKIWCPT